MKPKNKLNNAIIYIEQNITEDLNVISISDYCGISYSHLARLFKRKIGFTIKGYIMKRRMTLAYYEVLCSNTKFINIATKYNYSSNETFYRVFKKTFGHSPSEVRNNQISNISHLPMMIKYTIDTGITNYKFELLNDQSFTFYGKTTFVKEKKGKFKTRQDYMRHTTNFCIEQGLKDRYSINNPVYVMFYEIDGTNKEYNLLTGFLSKSQIKNDDFLSIKIPHKKFGRFTATGTSPESLFDFRRVIINEWSDTNIEYVPICEFDKIVKNLDDTYSLSYSFSIK